jgi:hypothetical protein
MGTQGFAMPSPLLPAMLINDYDYWLRIALVPFVFWFSVFFIFTAAKWQRERGKNRS